MKSGKTVKTLLIAAIGLIGSAAIIAGSSFVLSKLIANAEVSETDKAFEKVISAAASEQTVTACRSVSVSNGTRTEISVTCTGTDAILSVTETSETDSLLQQNTVAIDSIVFDQLTEVVTGYRLTRYAVQDTTDSPNDDHVSFTFNGAEYLLDGSSADKDIAAGAKALREVLSYYLP